MIKFNIKIKDYNAQFKVTDKYTGKIIGYYSYQGLKERIAPAFYEYTDRLDNLLGPKGILIKQPHIWEELIIIDSLRVKSDISSECKTIKVERLW